MAISLMVALIVIGVVCVVGVAGALIERSAERRDRKPD
jgi:hypothetical protein